MARLLDEPTERHHGWGIRRRLMPLDSITGMHPGLLGPGRLESALAAGASLLGARGNIADARRVTFLDLETTGLRGSGTLAWCLGLAWLESDGAGASGARACLEQVVLETPEGEAEAAALEHVLARLADAALVVTFNGRSYDLPLLEARCVLQRRPPPARRPDLDLLAPARRLLSRGEATLIALERLVGRERVDDLPGADVPRAWFDWLRHADATLARRAIDHNQDDLLAMLALSSWLAALAEGCPAASALASPLGHAELLARHGDRAQALRRLKDAGGDAGEDAAASRRRARLLHALAGRPAARADWERLIAGGERSPEPWEGLAKALEHDDGDVAAAAALVRRALGIVRSESGRRRLEARLERLQGGRGAGAAGPASRAKVSSRAHGLVDSSRLAGRAWKSSPSDIPSDPSLKSARS